MREESKESRDSISPLRSMPSVGCPLHTDPTEKGASVTCGTVMCTLTWIR
jgi:hypothetical protein